MPTPFDPYREWLGFPGNSPPNFFELLGIDESETDARKVSAAADRVMAKVRACKPGSHIKEWSAILDEVERARDCLSDSTTRTKYLAGLPHSTRRGSKLPSIVTKSQARAEDPNLFPPGMAAGPTETPQSNLSAGMPTASSPNPQSPAKTSDSQRREGRESKANDLAGPDPLNLPTPDVAMQPFVPVNTSWNSSTTNPQLGPPNLVAPVGPSDRSSLNREIPLALPAQAFQTLPSSAPKAVAIPIVRTATPAAVPKLRRVSAAALNRRRRRQAAWGVVFLIGTIAMIGALVAALRFGIREPPNTPANHSLRNDRPTVVSLPETERNSGSDSASAANGSQVMSDTLMRSNERLFNSKRAQPGPPIPTPAPVPVNDKDPSSNSRVPKDSERKPAVSSPAEQEKNSSPSPPAKPNSPKPTAADIERLEAEIKAARQAIADRDFAAADRHLQTVSNIPKERDHENRINRLSTVLGYVKQFHEALQTSIGKLKAGETFKVGTSTTVAFVESKTDSIVLRVAGKNSSYPVNGLPVGLAIALADLYLLPNDPGALMSKGAFVLTHPSGGSNAKEKARGYFQNAAESGASVDDLITAIDEFQK